MTALRTTIKCNYRSSNIMASEGQGWDKVFVGSFYANID